MIFAAKIVQTNEYDVFMRIAVIIDDINSRELTNDLKHLFLFEVDNQLITALGEEIVSMEQKDYIYLWLLAKDVKKLYINELKIEMKNLIHKLNLEIYPLNNIKDHPFLEALLYGDKTKS